MKDLQIVVTFGPMTIAYIVAFFALLNTALLIVAYKFGFIEWYSVNRRSWMPSCNFCLFFWMSFAELTFSYLKYKTRPFDVGEFAFIFAFALVGAVISRFAIGNNNE